MPNTNEPETSVEEIYRDHIRAMSGKERLAAAMNLCEGMRQAVEFQIKKNNPSLEGRALKFAVAEQIYSSCPRTLALLRRRKQELMERNPTPENGDDSGETLSTN